MARQILLLTLPLLPFMMVMNLAASAQSPVEGVDYGLAPPVVEFPIKGLPEGPLEPAPKLDPIQPTALEYECFQIANQARANPTSYGYPSYSPAPPLHWNAAILYIAWVHSKHMYDNNYFEHDSYARIGGELVFQRTWAERVKSVYSFNVQIAENIGWNTSGSAEQIVTAWMNSPPHRESLMNPTYTEGAIGAYGGSDKVYFTHDFGARAIQYNLAQAASNLTIEPANAVPGDTVRVRFTVANTGVTDAFPVEVQIHRRPSSGAWTAQTAVMWMKYIIPGGTSSAAYIDIDTTGMSKGTEIRVDIDPNNLFAETSEADNSAVTVLLPQGSTLPGDLTQDGVLDGMDLFRFAAGWRRSDPACNLNQQGGVDCRDLMVLIGMLKD